MIAILHEAFKVDHVIERIDEGPDGQQTIYKLVLRDANGRKISVLACEPFENVVPGDVVKVHVDRVSGGD